MGADIHMYIEYKTKKSNYWNNFAGKINPGRNYMMFGIMAGVREIYPDSFEPKGLPKELSYCCEDDYYLRITKDGIGEFCTTLENAEQWKSKIITDNNGNSKIIHPDWHSYSWMTIKEIKKVYKIYAKYCKKEYHEKCKIPCEYQAILDSMISLKKSGNKVRVVFWFDN